MSAGLVTAAKAPISKAPDAGVEANAATANAPCSSPHGQAAQSVPEATPRPTPRQSRNDPPAGSATAVDDSHGLVAAA
jgi:hypothetical protein